ncbi:beta-N-acetylhexosaminidase [Clostridium ganghwense]|uniref:beta-N-acetylhexosaminidase n=1 Tax=Clostridium ganghwense TaxID=312089 RepID=A0ABT4CJZ1_9CLOT|nr:beta-N-acetylhexosaminidase [Clostridium ganghwense]MCY6369368.1 beta-N-acetylhexosaminidase [Clostridium ganghwense]
MKRILILMIIVLTIVAGYKIVHIKDTNNFQEGKTKKILEKQEKKEFDNPEYLEEKKLNDMIDDLFLEEKLGQMIIVGFNGYEVNPDFRKLIEDYKIGGVILFERNIQNSKQLLNLNNSIKSINSKNKLPLFITVDEEGGRIERLPKGSTKFPSNKVIGRVNDEKISYEIGKVIGTELKAFGFNMNLAPILDIYSNPKNKVIGNRSFGTEPKIVSTLGTATMKGLQDANVISVVKHFPGHGDTNVDSHIGLPVVNYDKQRLDNFELIPFKNAVDKGADAVMTAHIVLPKIDINKKPATLSKKVLTDILRNEWKFNGVIITDDMEMDAIANNYSIKNAAVEAVKAGADVVLVCHTLEKQIEVLQELKKEVNCGQLSMKRIDESVKRIIKLKEKYGLNNAVNKEEELKVVGNQKHKEILNKLYK